MLALRALERKVLELEAESSSPQKVRHWLMQHALPGCQNKIQQEAKSHLHNGLHLQAWILFESRPASELLTSLKRKQYLHQR